MGFRETAQQFVGEYETVLRANRDLSWNQRKQLALTTASAKYIPDAALMIKTALSKNMVSAVTSQSDKDALYLAQRMGRTVRAIRSSEQGAHEVTLPAMPIAESETKRKSMSALYEDWCIEHDFVPSDTAIAYFSGYDNTTIANVRARLVKSGWKFDRSLEGGWIIREKSVPSNLNAEEAAAIRAVLSNPTLLTALKKLV